jgi:hypothetical protein
MPIELKPGLRLFSPACSTELIVVKAPAGAVDLTLGGAPVELAASSRSQDVQDGHGGGAAMGKRYVDEAGRLELLCTKAGDGVPAVNGVILHLKSAKALPSSD